MKVFETQYLELTGDNVFSEANSIQMDQGKNLALLQARDGTAIRMASDPGRGRKGAYFTIKANTAQLLSSFNFDGERVYLAGPSGTIVEYIIQEKP